MTMKSGSWASFQAALPMEARAGGEPDDDGMTDVQLIRQWWYVYHWTLSEPGRPLEELNALTKECEARGIVKPLLPMPRTGAEDLAAQCDEKLAKLRKQFGS
jgi:hypothetical protein